MSDISSRSARFPQWVAFLVFSTITLGSIVEVVKNNNSINNKDNFDESKAAPIWAIVCSALTFTTTLIIVAMHLHAVYSQFIIGTKIEGAICLILSLLHMITVSLVTDSRHGLAVDEFGAVENGNLYYFSWAGFINSITLFVSYLRHVYQIDVADHIRTRSARLTSWTALLATSLVVMGSSANFFDTMCGGQDDTGKCPRAVFGIVLGAMSTLASVMVVGMKIATAKAPFILELGLSFLLVTLYGFGVAILTSEKGPGAPLGNIYYFTWASFLASFMLLASCFEDYNAASQQAQENGNASTVDAINENNHNNATTPHHVIIDDLEDPI